jgi:hypothetical protein
LVNHRQCLTKIDNPKCDPFDLIEWLPNLCQTLKKLLDRRNNFSLNKTQPTISETRLLNFPIPLDQSPDEVFSNQIFVNDVELKIVDQGKKLSRRSESFVKLRKTPLKNRNAEFVPIKRKALKYKKETFFPMRKPLRNAGQTFMPRTKNISLRAFEFQKTNPDGYFDDDYIQEEEEDYQSNDGDENYEGPNWEGESCQDYEDDYDTSEEFSPNHKNQAFDDQTYYPDDEYPIRNFAMNNYSGSELQKPGEPTPETMPTNLQIAVPPQSGDRSNISTQRGHLFHTNDPNSYQQNQPEFSVDPIYDPTAPADPYGHYGGNYGQQSGNYPGNMPPWLDPQTGYPNEHYLSYRHPPGPMPNPNYYN